MIAFLLGLAVLTLLLGLAFKVTGAVLAATFWLFIKVPIAFVFWAIGIVCCCTLILIPVGKGCFKAGLGLMIP